jgi:uncharacterized heparinase superfamily protein
MMTAREAARLARSVGHLRPAQVVARARLRAQRAALERRLPLARRWLLTGTDPLAAVGWPGSFMPLDAVLWSDWPGLDDLVRGAIQLLGVTRKAVPADQEGVADWSRFDWEMPAEPLLWRFHLYYWDWAWAIAAQQKRPQAQADFAVLWESWCAAVRSGHGPAWHPYPAALRAWSFCGIHRHLVAGSPVEPAFLAELARHASFLRHSLELDVGGNHLVKNLKAITGLAVFFADDALLGRTLRRLSRQVDVQLLPDGGHYERAPAYHCQVLGDLIDLVGLLRAAGRPEPDWLTEAIGGMRRWLGAVLTPQGDVPLFNDGFPVSRRMLTLLAPERAPDGTLCVLPATGLARAVAGGWHLLADIGLPCPRDLPAHAHADTLSCIVFADRQPLLIDTGTSSYAAGAVRGHERSTAAHNTVEVDGHDSTEVWGAFRAGRRARVRGVLAAAAETVTLEAAHDGYRHLPGRPRHHRRWSLTARTLLVDDTVSGRGRHSVVVRWHLAPGSGLRLVPGGALVTTPAGEFDVAVTASSEMVLSDELAEVSTGYGRTVKAPVLVCSLSCELPARVSTRWQRAKPRQEP